MNRKIFKNLIPVVVLLTVCFANFASIVSDNDGSAFVTKSEFEALKKDFANQIQIYNDSIDNKIDGSIASYLAGIKLEKKIEQDSLLNKINDSCNDSYMSGTTAIKYGYRCMAKSYTIPTTQKPEGAVVNFFMGNMLMGAGLLNEIGGGWSRMAMNNASRTGLFDVTVPSSGKQNGKYIVFNKYNNKLYPDGTYDDIQYFYYVSGTGGANDTSGWPASDTTDGSVTWTFPQFKIEEEYWQIKVGDVNIHWNAASGGSYDNIKTFYGGTYKNNESINVLPVVGKVTGNVIGLQKTNLTKMRLQENSYDWELYGVNLFMSRRYDGTNWVINRSLNVVNKPNTTFYFNCHPYETVTLSDLIDYNATVAYGEGNVAIYGGLPLFKATNNGEVTMKIKFKSVSNNDVYIGLSTSQFGNDETYSIQSDLGLRNASDVKYTSNKFSVNTEYTFVMDVKRDQVVWIKTYDSSSNTGFTGAETISIELVSD